MVPIKAVPPPIREVADQVVYVRLTRSERAKLERLAIGDDRSLSGTVRRLIREAAEPDVHRAGGAAP